MPDRRRAVIVAELGRHDALRTEDLARRFEVSLETIRRDLLLLEQQGLVRRVFGGATRITARAFEPPFEERRVSRLPQKQAMAAVAAGLPSAGDTVIFDVGTSVAEVARAVPSEFGGRVLTNSVLVANELAGRPEVEVLVSGGRMRPGDLALSGPATVAFFDGFYADWAFLGSGGVDAQAGLTDYHLDEIAVRQVQVSHAAQCFVLADSSKLGHVAVGRVCALDAITAVITDDGADERTVDAIRGAGVEVLVAPVTHPQALTTDRTGT
jgi:DeoR/GlpR family transcriptional regulator of sugar metabolism